MDCIYLFADIVGRYSFSLVYELLMHLHKSIASDFINLFVSYIFVTF